MNAGPSHESPLLLLLSAGTSLAAGLEAVLRHPDVRHVAWPAPWCLDEHGIDLPAALPDVRTVDATTLPRVVETLAALASPEVLAAWAARRWQEVDGRVRDHYLQRGPLAALVGAFRRGPDPRQVPPPEAFRRDRVLEASVPIAYRLARAAGDGLDVRAPAEEATISFHPFDVHGRIARAEAGLPAGDGVVLEVFAYERGRGRHRALLDAVAAAHTGWRVQDPRATA